MLCVVILLSGCSNRNDVLGRAIALRNGLLDGDGCRFQAVVTADYGENIYTFTMECDVNKSGDLFFKVAAPTTIAGITGKITGTGGAIHFDEMVLGFPTIADGQITPVTAPWLLVKTLRGGYIKDCARNDNGFTVTIDDSYSDEAFQLNINVKDDLPISAEIFWKSRRLMTILIEDFEIL